jgi:hypothetical protein
MVRDLVHQKSDRLLPRSCEAAWQGGRQLALVGSALAVSSSGATTSKTVRDEDADSEWWGLAVRFDRTSRARPKMAAQGQFPLPSVRHSSSYDAVCALVEMSHNVSAPARRSSNARSNPSAVSAADHQHRAAATLAGVASSRYQPYNRPPQPQRTAMPPPGQRERVPPNHTSSTAPPASPAEAYRFPNTYTNLKAQQRQQWRHSDDVQSKHQQWQTSLRDALQEAPASTRALCEPATWLNPIETMLLLRHLKPEQVGSLSPPAVQQIVTEFREKTERLVFANPVLRDALSRSPAPAE